MKINVSFDAIVLATLVKDGKDGKHYYNASIFDPNCGEVGSLSMSEDAYKSCKPDVTKSQKLYAEYNDTYKSFRIVGVK